MKGLLAAATLMVGAALPLQAEVVTVAANADVQTTMDALEAAVENAGATVFVRVDHTKGAEAIGMELDDAQLLVFGNPKLGTPAMQDDPIAGLFLPLRVLVYKDADGKVWLAYVDPSKMLADLNIGSDAPYLGKMAGALAKLTGAAAGN